MFWSVPIIPIISLIAVVFTLLRAVKGSKNWLWGTGIFVYVFCFMALFSIGLFVVPLAFMFWVLAISYLLKLIKNKWHLIVVAFVGLMIGVLCVVYFKSYIFAPLGFLF